MKNDIVGFSITTNILFGQEERNLNDLLADIENEISEVLERKFNVRVIGGKGNHITANLDKISINK